MTQASFLWFDNQESHEPSLQLYSPIQKEQEQKLVSPIKMPFSFTDKQERQEYFFVEDHHRQYQQEQKFFSNFLNDDDSPLIQNRIFDSAQDDRQFQQINYSQKAKDKIEQKSVKKNLKKITQNIIKNQRQNMPKQQKQKHQDLYYRQDSNDSQQQDSQTDSVQDQPSNTIKSIRHQSKTFKKISKKRGDKHENGLKKLASAAYQIVSSQITTTFKEVAETLIKKLLKRKNRQKIKHYAEFNDLVPFKQENHDKAIHNIKRRAYDALNVLISTGLLRKVGKEVQVVVSYAKNKSQNLRETLLQQNIQPKNKDFNRQRVINPLLISQKQTLKDKLQAQKKRILEKKKELQILQKRKMALALLTTRNKSQKFQTYLNQMKIQKMKDKVFFPFIGVWCDSQCKQLKHQIFKNGQNYKQQKYTITTGYIQKMQGELDLIEQLSSKLASTVAQIERDEKIKNMSQQSESISFNSASIFKKLLPFSPQYNCNGIVAKDKQTNNNKSNQTHVYSIQSNQKAQISKQVKYKTSIDRYNFKTYKKTVHIENSNKKITDYLPFKQSIDKQEVDSYLQKYDSCQVYHRNEQIKAVSFSNAHSQWQKQKSEETTNASLNIWQQHLKNDDKLNKNNQHYQSKKNKRTQQNRDKFDKWVVLSDKIKVKKLQIKK